MAAGEWISYGRDGERAAPHHARNRHNRLQSSAMIGARQLLWEPCGAEICPVTVCRNMVPCPKWLAV